MEASVSDTGREVPLVVDSLASTDMVVQEGCKTVLQMSIDENLKVSWECRCGYDLDDAYVVGSRDITRAGYKDKVS